MKEVGQEEEGEGEGVAPHLWAVVGGEMAQRHILLLEVEGVEGQQNQGEVGRRVEMVEEECQQLESRQVEGVEELHPSVVEVVEQEVEQSQVWFPGVS